MKLHFLNTHYLPSLSLIVLQVIFFTGGIQAQSPTNYPPTVPKKVEINLFNIIVYFVLPVLMLIGYFLIRRSARKKESEKRKKE